MSKRILAISDGSYDSYGARYDGYSDKRSSSEPTVRKKKSRWSTASDTDKVYIPGMPTQLPPNLTPQQERVYIIQLQVEDLSRRLKCGELGIPKNPEERSPSPEPIYSSDGKRLNTREYRTRKKMEDDRHNLVQQLMEINPEYKPPSDYKPPQNRITDKVFIPQDNHPDINFVGLLIGPRGNTLKALEKETSAKVIIRGKGSVKDGKVGRRDGLPMPGEDEPLHAFISAPTAEAVQKAVKKINEIIRQGIEIPESQNDLRKAQLRELALLNGTLREHEGLMKLRAMAEAQSVATNKIQCGLCGGAGHLSTDCKVNISGLLYGDQLNANPSERAKMDSEYSALMAELGVGGSRALSTGLGSKFPVPRPPRQPPPPGVSAPEEEEETEAPTSVNGASTFTPSAIVPTTSQQSYTLPPPPVPPGHYPPMVPGAWPVAPMVMPGVYPMVSAYPSMPPTAGTGVFTVPQSQEAVSSAPSSGPTSQWAMAPMHPISSMPQGVSTPYQAPTMVPPPYASGYWGAYSQTITNPPPPPPPPGV